MPCTHRHRGHLRTRRLPSLLAGLALITTGMVTAGTATMKPAAAVTETFTAGTDWVVPDAVHRIEVRLIGGGGGDGGTNLSTKGHSHGGGGGIVTVEMDVTPGDTFHVGIGAAGGNGTGKDDFGSGGTGSGFGAGGDGNTGSVAGASSGGGGSGSYLSVGSGATSARSRIVAVAGGGGGAGGSASESRGAPGGGAGQAGSTADGPADRRGVGGSGTRGTSTGGKGGNANTNSNGGAGGGGGGGWYGGNGGGEGDGNLLIGGWGGGGGAGGSNHVDTDRATQVGSTSVDDNYGARGSVRISYVPAEETTTRLTATPSTVDVGDEVDLRAEVTVSGSSTVPAGDIEFTVGGAALAPPQPVPSDGVVELTTSALPVGSAQVEAAFEPAEPADHQPSSDRTEVTVEPLTVTLQLTGPPGPTSFGEPAAFDVVVEPDRSGVGTPTGEVEFLVDGSSPSAVDLDGTGQATLSVSSAAVGSHDVSARYTGDERFAGTSPVSVTHVVEPATPGLTVSSDKNPTRVGEPVTFTAALTGPNGAAAPTGEVRFSADGTVLDTVAVEPDGTAELTGSGLDVGVHEISAAYLGDGSFEATTSTPLPHRVDKGDVVVAVDPPSAPSRAGEPVDLDATLHVSAPAAGSPTGEVQFLVDGEPIGGPVPVVDGEVSARTTGLSVGASRITARYSGDRNFAEATSRPVEFVVDPNPATVELVSSADPTVIGEPVTVTAKVTGDGPGAPTGVVVFEVDGFEVDAVDVGPTGRTSTTLTDLGVGDHTVTAEYLGDGSFVAAWSDPLTQTVERGRVRADLDVPTAPVQVGDPIELGATFVPLAPAAGDPGGEVQFVVDGDEIGGPVSIVGGTGALRTDALEVGTHRITAVYSGDDHFEEATTVDKAVRVTIRPTAVVLDSSVTEGVVGQSTFLTATVTSPSPGSSPPTGTVSFFVDGSQTGAPVEVGPGGTAAVSITPDEGVSSLRATYSGDGTYEASGSDPVRVELVAEQTADGDAPESSTAPIVVNNNDGTSGSTTERGWVTSGSSGRSGASPTVGTSGTLPATGSRSSTLTVIGLLAIAAGAALLFWRRRIVAVD